ncbi:putative reverse transcriptase domain-containing protein [Tanacetum coccineum]
MPATVSPTADLPVYILESDSEEDDDEDPKENLVDYPTDRDDDDDDNDDEEEPSRDEANDEDKDEDEEEEEEEHPAPADSIPPPPVHHTTTKISIPAQALVPFLSEEEVVRFLAIPTLPLSLLTPLSSPLPQIPSLPLPVSLPLHISPPLLLTSLTYPLGFRAAMIRKRVESPSTSHSLPLPPPIILSHTRASVAMMRVAAPSTYGPRYEVIESSSAPRPTGGFRADYGFVATLDAEIRRDPERDDTVEIYGRLDEAHDARAVLSGRLNLLQRDRRSHVYTNLLMEREARLSCQQAEIAALRAADHTRQAQLVETLRLKMAPKRTTRSTPDATATTTTFVTNKQLKVLIDQGVANALAAHDADRSRNGKNSHDSGTGVRRQAPPARECTYPDFMKCKPLYFKGTEGVIELTQWFKRMETMFHISNCSVVNQIKFATCTLLRSALTWWNSHVTTIGHDVAHAMTWTNLKKKLTDKYWPKGEIKKLEVKMWNLNVKGTDVVSYNQRFQELALMCARMFPEESDKIQKYVGGLPDMIHESSENKRKQDDNQQQQLNKKQNTGRAYVVGSGEKKPYGGSKPLCSKCNYHHDGQCAPKCHKCNRVGHLARDCRGTASANTSNNQRGTRAGQKPTCYECGAQGHFKRDCPKLKNNNRGNQAGNGNAPAKVYAIGRVGTNPDSNVVTGTFLLNNRYAFVLFDTSADRSFVSTTFNSQIDITPTTLNHYYDVELADRRIIRLNAIIRGCTLNFLNHPFNVDLMPVELGSFDVIISMDWLAKYQVVIVCAEKIICIP